MVWGSVILTFFECHNEQNHIVYVKKKKYGYQSCSESALFRAGSGVAADGGRAGTTTEYLVSRRLSVSLDLRYPYDSGCATVERNAFLTARERTLVRGVQTAGRNTCEKECLTWKTTTDNSFLLVSSWSQYDAAIGYWNKES